MAIEIIDILGQKNNGEFPLVDSNDIRGGFYQVDTIEERDLIPSIRRKEGMLCAVKNDKMYQLVGGVDNSNWIIFNSGSGSGFSGDYNDLINKPNIPSKTSDLVNDSGFITVEDLDTSQNHTHENFSTLEKITEEKINQWDNKSDFDGDYDSLTNKPEIPNIEDLASKEELNLKADKTELEDLATKEEVDEKISNIASEIEVDVYHVGSEPPVDTEMLWIDTDDETLDVEDKTIIDELTNSINNNRARIDNLSSRMNDITVEDNLESVNPNKPLSAKQGKILSDRVTRVEKTSHSHTNMDVIDKITTSKITSWDNKSNFSGNYNDLKDKPNIPSLVGYATEQFVKDEINKIQLEGGGVDVDLSSYALKSELPTKTSQLLNDSKFLTNIPSEYITESELESKGYLTAQSIIEKADKTELHNHSNKDVLDSITSSKVSQWDSKSDFSGNYNDLTNKPAIPSIYGLATEIYVNEKVAEIVDSSPETLNTLNELANALGNDPNFATTIANRIGLKADKTELHSHTNKSVIDSITSAKVTEWDNKSNFSGNYNDLTNKPNIPSLAGYATEQFVKEEVEKAQLSGGEVDLSGYALKTELHNHSNKSILDGITSTKISQWDSKSNFSGSYNDLTNKPTIPTKTSQLSNDSNYITSIPNEYVTESELSNKGYLTSIPNTYALKTDIPTIPTSLPANGGNANTVGGYSIWIGTQSQYDAISTKSNTTIYMIEG